MLAWRAQEAHDAKPMSRLFLLALVAGALLAACGARSELAGELPDAAALPIEAGPRSCPFECYVGHECCAGSCSAPPVPMESDCCSCLPGEVDSRTCGHPCGK